MPPVKICVVGFGNMGRCVAEMANNMHNNSEGVKLSAVIDTNAGLAGQIVPGSDMEVEICRLGYSGEYFGDADVIVDFSSPSGFDGRANMAGSLKKPFVIGTTSLSEANRECLRRISEQVPCILAPNFSIEVNIQFATIARIVRALGDDYDIEIIERHHRKKADAPSGTAIYLAEIIKQARKGNLRFVYGREGKVGPRASDELGIHAVRGGAIFGTHEVLFAGPGGNFQIITEIHSRDSFAKGALLAVKWVIKQGPGLYDMQDVLGLR